MGEMKTLIVAAALCAAALHAAPGVAQVGREGGPIDITADSTEFLSELRVSRWSGNVDVRQGEGRLLADQLDVHFAEAPDGGVGEVVRLVAEGAVSYITAEETARGDRGEYRIETDEIVLTGNVTLVRGRDTLTGDQLIVEPSAGRSRLVSSDAPVRAVFYPEEEGGGVVADDNR